MNSFLEIGRRRRRWLATAAFAMALMTGALPGVVPAVPVAMADTGPASIPDTVATDPTRAVQEREAREEAARPQPPVVEAIEFEGRERTPRPLALEAAGLGEGDPLSPETILLATERLRESRLFREVDVRTRRGSGPGRVVVVFIVRENHPHFRLGLGYEDFSGWYLIPLQLNMDNLTGHGEGLSLNSRIGYRVGGLDLTLRSPAPISARNFWEVRVRGEGQDRVYFFDSTEVAHHVARGGLDLKLGRRFSGAWSAETWLSFETTEADSGATVNQDRLSQDRTRGDAIDFAELPAEIQRDLRRREQTRAGLALVFDRRGGAGLAAGGVMARVSAEGVWSEFGRFGAWEGDARAYVPLKPGIQLSARVRGGAVSAEAPFYERFYVGGLYTVRGYPSQSLSPAHGHLNIGTASIELRTAWVGPAADPRFVGILFADAGAGWNRDLPGIADIAAGIGYGFRVRVPWLGRIGVDVARPLSSSPLDESFHASGSLGWTF